MASRSDEVEQGVNTIITESWITFNARLFCKNVVVLPFEIANDFSEAARMMLVRGHLNHTVQILVSPSLVIDLVSKARSINDSQRYARSLLIQFQFFV